MRYRFATFLIAALKDQKRTKGKTRMQAFNGKSTKVFVIKTSELKRFAEEARKYGVLYAAVANRTRSRTCANAAVPQTAVCPGICGDISA